MYENAIQRNSTQFNAISFSCTSNVHASSKRKQINDFTIVKTLVPQFHQVILTLAFTLLCTSVFGQNLFDEMPTSAEEESVFVADKIKLRKENQLNKSVIKINLNKIKQIQKEDGKFNFKIPNDNSLHTAYSQYVEVKDDDNYQWNGEVVDKEGNTIGYVTLSEVEGASFGEIHVNERSFVIEDFGKSREARGNGRITYLIEKDTEATKDYKCGTSDTNSEESHESPKKQNQHENQLKSFFCNSNVRVLVLFTTAADNAQNGNQAAVTFINQSNQALRNSGINATALTFQLAAAQLFNGVNDQDDQANADNLLNRITINPQAEQIRNNVDADIVVLLTNSPFMGNIFGVAHLHNLNDRGRSHAVVQINAPATRFSFVHELAHNFGCKHDDDNRTLEGLTAYARGKAWTQNGTNRRTIMALAGNLERIQNFSNPSIFFNGIRTGDANSRDNARQLREQAVKMSNYEVGQDPVQAIVSGPTTIINTTDMATWCATSCNLGINIYQWAYSTNGFTYFNFGTNSSCVSSAQNAFGTASTIYIRVICTYTNGQTSTTIYPVSNRQDIQQMGGGDVTQLKLSNSAIVIEKLAAHVYPNPNSDGRIQLKLMIPTESLITIEVYNSLGQLEQVIARDKKYPIGITNENINMTVYTSGLKYIRIDDGISQEILPVTIQ